MKKEFSHETRLDILRDYNNPDNKVSDLAAKYQINRGRLAHIAVEMGATPRNSIKYGKSKNKATKANVCPKCRKHVDVKGAKYCCFCGSDIRTPKQKLIERLTDAIRNVALLPENMRDEMRDVMLEAIEELKR